MLRAPLPRNAQAAELFPWVGACAPPPPVRSAHERAPRHPSHELLRPLTISLGPCAAEPERGLAAGRDDPEYPVVASVGGQRVEGAVGALYDCADAAEVAAEQRLVSRHAAVGDRQPPDVLAAQGAEHEVAAP